MDKNLLIQRYNIYIFERIQDLINSGKKIDDFDYKSDLHKIFEYYSCIKLTQEYNVPFYEYSDINPSFKEEKNMSKNDTGIDACNLIDTIVQCKLRQKSLTWKECSTFFGSLMYRDESGIFKPRWNELIITRNQESKLSDNLNEKLKFKLFIDKTYPRTEIISYCKELIDNPPKHFVNDITFKKRDYQEDCIKMINNMNNQNLIICLPTGSGKNYIIVHSLKLNIKYLILVPRIILMEQINDEIIKIHPNMKYKIQLIGDSNNKYKSDKDITICVFNSVDIVKEHIKSFDKIFVDEAHHIRKPEIYEDEEDKKEDEDEDEDEEDKKEDEDEDLENEKCDNKTFIQTIQEFSKFNNNIYLSATIDEHSGFKFYKKDIREMIEKGYLCDYTINIPIFNEDPTNLSVCKYLVKNYRNIIIYCNSQKDGISINKLMNLIQKGCSEYIDCNTSRKKRNDIISKYKSGKLPFLVNVKILVEGFDAPITKGICFMSLPSSSTTLIQIIGRALRLHSEKKIANVILPFSKMDDEKAICNFMKIMAKNDPRIRKSYDNKKLGGYFEIENLDDVNELDDKDNDEDDDIDEDDLMKDIDIKYELVFDSIGKFKNREEIWMNRLEEVKNYIDKNNKLPSEKHINKKIKSYGQWLSNQKNNYKNMIRIMKNDIFYNKFKNFLENYKDYLLSNEEIWNNNLEKVIKYINENHKLPSSSSKNKEIKYLVKWLIWQKNNYKNKIKIMKNDIIYNKFKIFLENYKEYFTSNEEIWNNNLKKVIKYINENHKLPSQISMCKETKSLACWLSTQKDNYKNKTQIMKNINIYNAFRNFQETYKKYFISNEEIWSSNLEKIIKYINENHKLPSSSSKNKEIKSLASWLSSQKKNYKIRKEIMKNDIIYNKFTEFIEKYKDYLLSNEEIWINNLEKVIKYINKNNKTPSHGSKDKEIKILGTWFFNQKKNYQLKKCIMKNEIIYNKFKIFIYEYNLKI
jgi:superfamily II DNA/RNA helicase